MTKKPTMRPAPLDRAAGLALLPVLGVLTALLIAAVATMQLTRTGLRSTADQVARHEAFYIADAGIQRGIAQLSQDRASAATSTAYTSSVAEGYAAGNYTVSIVQDPLAPLDPLRKQILSEGRFANQRANLLSHVVVQNENPCQNTVVFADGGTAQVVSTVSVGAAPLQILGGNVVSNGNVMFQVSGLSVAGTGNVIAGGNFVDTSPVAVLSTFGNLFRGGNYVQAPTHLIGHLFGVHFSNPGASHGVQMAMPGRRLPLIDYDRAKREADVIVNAETVPFGSWHAPSGTWDVPANLAVPAGTTRFYYVDGNVRLGSGQLARGATLKIVARGWVSVESFQLLAMMTPGAVQRLYLAASGPVYIGRRVTSLLPFNLQPAATALADSTLGIGLAGAGVAHQEQILAYSERAEVWGKLSSLDLLSDDRVCFLGKTDSTLAFTGSVLSRVRPLP